MQSNSRFLELETRAFLATEGQLRQIKIEAEREIARMKKQQEKDEERPEYLAAVAYLTKRELRLFPSWKHNQNAV
jgi:hypothetical protein